MSGVEMFSTGIVVLKMTTINDAGEANRGPSVIIYSRKNSIRVGGEH